MNTSVATRSNDNITLAVPAPGQNNYTPEITKVKFHRKMQLKANWTIRVRIHWRSDNPFEHAAEQ